MSTLDKAKEVFLDNSLDEETYLENQEIIQGWATELSNHKALASWQGHEMTQVMLTRFNKEYVTISLKLANTNNLTEQARMDLFARKNALEFVFSLMSGNAKAQLDNLNKEIRAKVSLFSG